MYTKWNHKIVLLLVAVLVMASAAIAGQRSPDDVWDQSDKATMLQSDIDVSGRPSAYETFRLNRAALEALLKQAPEENSGGASVILSLPIPDGSYSRFEIEHSLVVEPGLLEKYPELGATYRGRGIDDPTAYARFDFLPSGFHSMILSPNGTVIVNPYAKGDTENYISYYKKDRPSTGQFECEVNGDDAFASVTTLSDIDSYEFLPKEDAPEVISGTQLRTYRLALAANNEYCSAVGGNTVAGCLAAQVLIMNRVNGVYEKDVAIRMVIVANNNLIVYAGDNLTCPVPGGSTACTAANDPYGNDTSALDQNTPNLNTVIGAGNYDIGHVFTTGSGGVAFLGVPCGASKGGGTTGLPNPVGDDFAIDYVAHEMGHQWGANHTFNGNTGNCAGGNRSGGSAYEPGSGITIMAYAGICGNQDLAQHSIDSFHVKSLEVITAYSQTGGGNTCAVTTASGNTPPSVTGPGNFTIPKQSAFALTATASDVNPGDSITYDWQEYDLGAATTTVPNTDADGIKPIFRPYSPTASGTRFFPSLQYILNNGNVPPSSYNCGRGVGAPCLTGELLPNVARTMTFQVVARDNHPGTGGINSATSLVTVDANSGPFVVTAPNTNVSWTGNTFQTVTWNVANTTAAPVSAANVKISLSTDGGQTFPTVLAASTANDGTQDVLIPNTASTTARIKVEAVGNIFFDISNTNFTIAAGSGNTPTATATATGSPSSTNTATATATATPIACGVWVAGPVQPPARYTVQAALGSDNKLYLAGGSSADATPVLTSQVSRFDPATNSWSNVAPMPVAIGQGAMGSWNGKIYVAGGFLGGTAVTNALRIYDIATNAWSSGANVPTPGAGLEAAAGAVVNGKFYVMGGDDFNVALNTTYIYDIATNTWTTGAVLPDNRTNTYATSVGGLVYVYGGATGASFTATDTLLRYDPVANSWTNLGTAGTGGRGNYGAVSPYGTGQLLITSGATTAFVASNITRIFTISTGAFSAGPAMITARAGHGQGTLADGRVLVADGLDTASTVTSNVEIIGPCGSSTPTNTPTATSTSTVAPTNTATATSTPTRTSTNTPTNTPTSGPSATATGTPPVTVALPAVSASPGATIVIPVTVGDTTGRSIIAYDFQINYNPAVVQPAMPEFDQVGTLSSAMSVTPNSANAGHLIVSAFQSLNLAGSGTLLNLRFTVVGSAGQSTALTFADYTDPSNIFHPAFLWNEGDPPALTTNGSVTVSGGPTGTATATATATATGTPVGQVFANSAAMCTTLGGAADLYPSTITVAGGPPQINTVRVTLFNVVHQLPDNMDFLLVGPQGQKFILMSDAGGSLPQATPGVTLTFDDNAGQVLPDSAPLVTGTFEPTSWEAGQTSFPAPAPAAPYNQPGSTVGGTGTQTLFGNFGGTNSNGTWSLYMRDDAGLFNRPAAITGCVNGGWQLQFLQSTAANASIAGRVLTAGGQGIRNAKVVITGGSLEQPLVVTTGSFGYYSAEGLQAGQTYIVTVISNRYTFSSPTRIVSLVDNIVDADFVADPQQ